ncbi:conserved exported protein of unknown function [Shewanella benthica]|uniref:Phosphate-selective porin O and P n=1 Tax=Shewanella benthica TaxID=43661 RepID=A0A330M807_9GAMM|nr:hypothetical protein [Shewanella benthica]SQH78242.1 conserved exported protein of unknown function [Shewanella benthica]
MKTKLSLLALCIAGFSCTSAMAATEPAQLEQAIAKQEAELNKLKHDLAELAAQQKMQLKQQEEQAEVVATARKVLTESKWSKFSFKSYGSMTYTSDEYYQNVQDTSPERRGRFDLERIVTEFGYQFNDEWDMEVEIEYEHGGTGIALEYDGFDEFGEFETEVEAGGEVMIEKAELRYRPSDEFGVKFGNIHLPIGLSSILHKPDQYLTVLRHRSEAAMLPAVWNEMGVGIFGEMANFHYQAQVVSGLNSEYFRTYDWIASGHQTRFEEINADNLAYALRLDYGNFKQGSAVGVAYYYGNTSGNRHKSNKVSGDGTVSILAISGAFVQGPWILRGQYLHGTLSDADAITQANKTTPGLKPGNFAQLGSESEAFFVEAGVDLSYFTPLPITIFANIDYSNPLADVDTGTASKRYENTWTSIGINYFPIAEIVIKAEAGRQQVAASSIPDTNFFALGVGYQFSL